jgi:hypothetical protein
MFGPGPPLKAAVEHSFAELVRFWALLVESYHVAYI